MQCASIAPQHASCKIIHSLWSLIHASGEGCPPQGHWGGEARHGGWGQSILYHLSWPMQHLSCIISYLWCDIQNDIQAYCDQDLPMHSIMLWYVMSWIALPYHTISYHVIACMNCNIASNTMKHDMEWHGVTRVHYVPCNMAAPRRSLPRRSLGMIILIFLLRSLSSLR